MADAEALPRFDRLLGWAIGKLLLWVGQRAYRRGDMHEFDHIRAAVDAGNSVHSRYPCRLVMVREALDG